ncbi:hypothetical protein JCM11491_002070 [Sporobolomyces phaffii]
MALVSSITPSTSLYPGSPSIHARTTPDPHPPPHSPVVRKSPSLATASPPPSKSMSASSSKSSVSGLPGYGQPARRDGYTGLGPIASSGGGGSSPSSSAVRLPSPLPPPTRSSSTPPVTSVPSSPARPTATPLPVPTGSLGHHHHSNSSSSIPRAPPAQYHQTPQHPQTVNYMSHPQLAHPSFVGQPYSPFAPPHAFAHPAFPFVPSPHPSNSANSYVSYSPNGQVTPGGSAEQHKRMQAFQQAQWSAAAGQMELSKNQQQQNLATPNYPQDGRKRTASSPASQHPSPTYHTTSLPYPPSPSPSIQQTATQYGPASGSNPSFPAGAMLPHFAANHGYPTPPGSVEGTTRGGESGGSSSGGSREGGYHPYRRDHHATKASSSESGTRSSSTPRSPSTTPTTSSASSRVPAPKLQTHVRAESAQSHVLPRSHAPSLSVTSIRSATLPEPFASEASFSGHVSRPRAESSNSSSSSLNRVQYETSPSLSVRPRTTSFDSSRSSHQAQTRPRPSPLGGIQQRLPAESDEDSDEGADSDGTAEATATVNRTATVGGMVTTKMAPQPAVVGFANGKGKEKEKEKEKEKKGMASRFKKAFGGGSSSSSSSTTLTEAELDGRGPKDPSGGRARRLRANSVSSSETSTNPRTPTSAHASQPSTASVASSSARTVNGDADSTRKAPSSRFRLLNSKLNSSTDNISISSTVSSASVMIRKLGQMGKLARRNSLMGLTKAFKKDKTKDDAEDDPLKSSSKKDKKSKSGASLASVSHATAEVESSPRSAGMSPAAALAKRQQMHYAEQEAAEAKARAVAAEEAAKLGPPSRSHGRTDSDGASVKSGKSGRWGMGRSKTTDDVSERRTTTVEKEKELLKSRGKGSKFGRLGFGGSKTDLHSDTRSVIGDAGSIAGTDRGGSALGLYQDGDATPRQSLEVLAPPQSYATYGAESVRRDSSSDYEPSLYRNGATPPAQGNAVRGILKGAGTYSQEQYARPRPGFHRIRASSFDAPQQQGRPGSPGGATLVNVIPTQAQVDGVAPSLASPRFDTLPPSSTEHVNNSVLARLDNNGASAVYGNPSLNASAPVLTQFAAQASIRSNSAPGVTGRRIAFAANLSVHTTWPAAIYDRRAEPATCNRLTPSLAQQIKEELNSFKMEEMDVHPDSRKLTHFFV